MDIAVVDDEKAIREHICGLVEERQPESRIEAYATGGELLASGKRFDIVFLDIQNEVVYQDSNSRKLFSLDLGSGETKALAQYGTVHVCSAMEGEYFYTCNWTECREKNNFEDYGIEVFGADGNKVAAIPMEEEMSWEYGDGWYLFAIEFHEGDRTVSIIDKDQMLKGETEWKPVLTMSGEDADNEGDEDYVKNEDYAGNEGDAYEDGSEKDFME